MKNEYLGPGFISTLIHYFCSRNILAMEIELLVKLLS